MELKELTERTLDLLSIKNTSEMSQSLLTAVINNNLDVYEQFCRLVENDLSIDWMQKIYQYYEADKKNKMQDFTPVLLARFVGKLAGEADTIIDMCSGSGALTIQKWNLDKNKNFLLYEFDENVIPFLLFNMAVRNIECVIYHADVLQEEIFKIWKIEKGKKFGKLKEEENETHADI